MIRIRFYFLFALMWVFLPTMTNVNYGQESGSAQGNSGLNCQQIAVIGAVRKPGPIDVPRRLRLLDVLSKVGGPNEQAGKTVRIVHACGCLPCDKLETKPGEVSEFKLFEVLRGSEKANPFVAPGDVVIIPKAPSVFVMGTWRETGIPFVQGMTATRAIALAGGPFKSSAVTSVRIYRTSSNGRRPEPIMINLGAITTGDAEDPLLQPWDVLEVSDDHGQFQRPRPIYPIWDPLLKPHKDSSSS